VHDWTCAQNSHASGLATVTFVLLNHGSLPPSACYVQAAVLSPHQPPLPQSVWKQTLATWHSSWGSSKVSLPEVPHLQKITRVPSEMSPPSSYLCSGDP
jgi:hypothetical protein